VRPSLKGLPRWRFCVSGGLSRRWLFGPCEHRASIAASAGNPGFSASRS